MSRLCATGPRSVHNILECGFDHFLLLPREDTIKRIHSAVENVASAFCTSGEDLLLVTTMKHKPRRVCLSTAMKPILFALLAITASVFPIEELSNSTGHNSTAIPDVAQDHVPKSMIEPLLS